VAEHCAEIAESNTPPDREREVFGDPIALSQSARGVDRRPTLTPPRRPWTSTRLSCAQPECPHFQSLTRGPDTGDCCGQDL
jgi:hypothetical protein